MVDDLISTAAAVDRLSVLALSSRFDGPEIVDKSCSSKPFQYSLCRVVLMVPDMPPPEWNEFNFQYSLCRVVLMVVNTSQSTTIPTELSVLALSSRFDGRWTAAHDLQRTGSFSTRSVESF